MAEYDEDEKFPLGLLAEEKAALLWKAEQDYVSSNLGAISFRNEYITFAINFYTRNIYSLEDVMVQYRAHCKAERRRSMALAFLADMQDQLRDQEMVN